MEYAWKDGQPVILPRDNNKADGLCHRPLFVLKEALMYPAQPHKVI
jgi:hypothetical protein